MQHKTTLIVVHKESSRSCPAMSVNMLPMPCRRGPQLAPGSPLPFSRMTSMLLHGTERGSANRAMAQQLHCWTQSRTGTACRNMLKGLCDHLL